MATFKGKGGSITFATNVVAQVRSWNVTCEAEILDITHMGDNWEKKDSDLGRWTAGCELSFDYGDTLGQKVLVDRVTGAVPVGTSGTVELLVATGKKLTGSAFVASFNATHAIRAVAGITFSLIGHDSLTLSWV